MAGTPSLAGLGVPVGIGRQRSKMGIVLGIRPCALGTAYILNNS